MASQKIEHCDVYGAWPVLKARISICTISLLDTVSRPDFSPSLGQREETGIPWLLRHGPNSRRCIM